MLKAVIFDFDLTLADSVAGIVECVNYALVSMELPSVDPGEIRRTVGFSLQRTFQILSGVDDVPAAEAFVAHFVDRADQVMVDLTRMFPEVAPSITEVRRRGLRTAIVSTKFRYRIQAVLKRDGIEPLFDLIVGGEDVTRHKPDPEGLHVALRKLQIGTEAAIYVGDHAVDAEAAQLAGVRFIAVPGGRSSDMSALPVFRSLESLSELPDLLDSISS
jgi:phosphoglycolate phosphatase